MSSRSWFGVMLTAFFSLPLSGAAIADDAGGLAETMKRVAPAARAQYDDNDCWYNDGWRGPGWYLCGDEWDYGVGWAGSQRGRRHHRQGAAAARSGTPNHRPIGAAGVAGFSGSGVHVLRHSGAGGAGLPSLHSGGSPPTFHSQGGGGGVVHGFAGAAPAVHGSGGAAPTAVHGSGGVAPSSPNSGAGGFGGSSGGGSFPSSAHGGMGH